MKRLLLDENLPRQLKSRFSSDFDVTSVPGLGWQSKKNGELLAAMDTEEISYLLTADRNLRYQQNLERYSVVVVVSLCFDTRIESLAVRASQIESEIVATANTAKLIEIDLRSS
ncbi:MAG: hypothetical protein WBO10_10610 [Pyrinomonadaceae bacterium]